MQNTNAEAPSVNNIDQYWVSLKTPPPNPYGKSQDFTDFPKGNIVSVTQIYGGGMFQREGTTIFLNLTRWHCFIEGTQRYKPTNKLALYMALKVKNHILNCTQKHIRINQLLAVEVLH